MDDFKATFVKLDARHNLYHKGYRFAYRCVGYSSDRCDRYELEAQVKKIEKVKLWDNTYMGKVVKDAYGGYRGHVYWIGMKHESTHTMVALMKDYL